MRAGATKSFGKIKHRQGMMGRWACSVAATIAILVFGPASLAQGLISKKYALDREQNDDAARPLSH